MIKREFTFDKWIQKLFAGRPPTWDWLWNDALYPKRADLLITYPKGRYH